MLDLPTAILAFLQTALANGAEGVPTRALQEHFKIPRSSLSRILAALVAQQRIEPQGKGRAATYRLPAGASAVPAQRRQQPTASSAIPGIAKPNAATASPPWSAKARALLDLLQQPLGTRMPVSYRREFVDDYRPNITSLLPPTMAEALFERGRAHGQMPAATYARQMLQQLLIDLSWYSSRLEGNRKSLLDTRDLFERGRTGAEDLDAVMLLNHKEAIEFLIEAVPAQGMTTAVVRNLQSLLMSDLLVDTASLGTIRQRVVQIQDTVYQPAQVPRLLEEMLEQIVEKVRQTRNPIEAAFFLWVNIAYLQPFVDGNKRTSRLAANMPLMLFNCAPLSFLEVGAQDYALAMLGVYERLDVTLAAELFEWTYRRSIDKYQAVVQSIAAPDPLRVRYRPQLATAMQQIVFFGQDLAQALAQVEVAPEHEIAFRQMLDSELDLLGEFNCARYRLPAARTKDWIARGRPR
ncbi:Fic family protein [Xylophilus rhododendri]|uniref:Fic family protein n=1 Tax=Xylophilus rhododendri TaxID=2697032 RepID=A0A857J611_9BURK|nr:Fic family protein [Xylophilus rhododendri]QHI98431.1 Fic family protein [Xylophilus rhododendri]